MEFLEFIRICGILYLECLINHPFQTVFWTILLPAGELTLHRRPELVLVPLMALTLWWADNTNLYEED